VRVVLSDCCFPPFEGRVPVTDISPIYSFGSCGGLVSTLPVGSLVVPKSSLGITRNYDFDFLSVGAEEASQDAYHISRPVCRMEAYAFLVAS
jgi:uridine phosphorylase